MNLFPLIGLVLLSPVFSPATSAAEPVHAFVPGQPMRFPMSSAGVAEDLAKLLSVNCKTDDVSIQARCEALLRERAENCGPQAPAVFDSSTSYKAWAKSHSICPFPRPICRGIEVASLDECNDSSSESRPGVQADR